MKVEGSLGVESQAGEFTYDLLAAVGRQLPEW